MRTFTVGLGILLTAACTRHQNASNAADADRAPMPSRAIERAPATPAIHVPPADSATLPLTTGSADRAYSVALLTRVAEPVLVALSRNELKRRMAVEDWDKQRSAWTHYEAFAHTLAGVAPWIALGPDETPEGQLRQRFALLARQALVNATDPSAPDYLGFGRMQSQPLAESACLAYAILRAKDQLWEPLDASQRKRVIAALKTTRRIRAKGGDTPIHAAMVEAAVWELEGRLHAQLDVIEEAVVTTLPVRAPGADAAGLDPNVDADYRGYLVQPMLVTILQVAQRKRNRLVAYLPEALEGTRRATASLERRISPDATLPVAGPSPAHKFAAYFQLSNGALDGQLDPSVAPSAVRAAVTTAARRIFDSALVDDEGWLHPEPTTYGARADEPSFYTGGSLYVCLTGFVHLGLPETDPFWSDAPVDWTARRQLTAGGPPRDQAEEPPLQ